MSRNDVIVILIMSVIGIGLFLVTKFNSAAPLSFCTIAAGLITFFHFMGEPNGDPKGPSGKDSRLRCAIAGAIVVQYLVLVGIVAYLTKEVEKLPPITESLIGSFTTIVGVVIAFYFGSSIFIEGRKKEQVKDPLNKNEK